MASSSASTPSWKYDVFLSFRGEDTRRNFTDHLHAALRRYGIKTFIDDQLRRGEQISPALLQAIEDSRFSIIIFSQNYASSSWCLDELSKILDCVDKGEHKAFPIFYEVDPSHVRHQRGDYEEAFKKHEEAYKNNMEKVVKWRQALTTISGYSGWDTRDRHQYEVIKDIVSKIFSKVPVNPSSSNKIGMDSRVKAVLSLLCIGSHDVRMVGIWGMAGIGKTTLAEVIYQRIHTQFEGYCFLSNVREKSQTIENLQLELLSKLLPEENLGIRNFNMGSDSIRKALRSKQVLIVLDDVNHIEQLDKLVGHCDWFGPKSRIIVTTRDKRLLIEKDVEKIYEVEELQNEEARTLFYRHAFKDKPPKDDFKKLCDRSLHYTKGNPLAIKILGRLLYKRTKKEWDCELEKLQKFPNKDVQEVLRISFDGLEDTVKNIFLDIACFFKGRDKDYVSKLLKCCDFYPETGILTLVERALVTVSNNNILCMHDLIQEMGWEIVRQQSNEFPGKRSRLWLKEDVKDVLVTNSGTETIQGMVIDLSASEELYFNVDVFTKMINLRVLKFRNLEEWEYDFVIPYKMHLTGDFKNLSNNLRYLWWEGYPLKFLPSNFNPRKLFDLNMSFSRLEQLWEGYKPFQNLEYLDLRHSRDLIRTPDLSGAPELKKINLKSCTSLVEIHSSIETLEKLSFLNLRYCLKLEEVAKSFQKLTSLKTVDFLGCSKLRKLPDYLRISSPHLDLSCFPKLEELPKTIGELTSLNLNGCFKLRKLPNDIWSSLVTLNLSYCLNLKELPKSMVESTSLKTLSIRNCSRLKKLPHDIGKLQSLKELVADGSGIRQVPRSVYLLTRLKELSLGGCKTGGFSKTLDLSNLISSSPRQELRLPSFLVRLKLSDCNLQEYWDMSSLCRLEYLNLSGNSFVRLPCLTQLTQLSQLRLEGCKSLRALTELPSSIRTVWASNCESLETFSHPPLSYGMSTSCALKFDFSNCGRLLENEASLDAILGGIRTVPQFDENRSFGAVVTGRRVPEWFIHQSKGNSIIVKLPPEFHGMKVVGLGFCAVLGRKLSPLDSDHLWFGYGSNLSARYSDHLWFGYGSASVRSSKRVRYLKFSFDLPGKNAAGLVVKECGIRILYLPDDAVEKLNQRWDRFPCAAEFIIEHKTVNAPLCCIRLAECACDNGRCWERTIETKYPGQMYWYQCQCGTKETKYPGQMDRYQSLYYPKERCPAHEHSLMLYIDVEGCYIYIPNTPPLFPRRL